MANYSQIMLLQKLCVVLSLTILLATNITTSSATKIHLPLIHHGSISSFHQHDIVGTLWPEKSKAIFLVAVSIGEPPVSQLLAMDTGSEIIWVCTTCNNDYDPKLSSTYETVTCYSTHECLGYFDPSRCRGSQCAYNISYADGTYNSGVLAKEKFTFQTSSEGVAELPDMMFGSGLDVKWHGEILSGIFGLNPFGEHSLVTHVGNKFSYCIGNISDPGYMHNHLILGDGAIFDGSSTPLTEEIEGKYYIHLEGVSVGDKQLEIDESAFSENTLIDSGSTSTLLTRGMFDVLRDELVRLLNRYHLTPVQIGSLKSCYSGNLFRDLKGFPTVTLRFANGASLVMNVEALFRMETDYDFCLNIEVSESDINTLGVYAQQYYNFGFDFSKMTVSFLNIECSLLND